MAEWQTHMTQNHAGQPVPVRVRLPAPRIKRTLNAQRSFLLPQSAHVLNSSSKAI